MFTFIKRNYVLLLLVLGVSVIAAIPAYAAQQAAATPAAAEALGPFAGFLRQARDLFIWTRNALFVITAFVFIKYAWDAMTTGKFELKDAFFLLVALILLTVAGFVVDWFAPGADAAINTVPPIGRHNPTWGQFAPHGPATTTRVN